MSTAARASYLLASALDVAYAGDANMTLAVHASNGSVFTIDGSSRDTGDATGTKPAPLDFEPRDVAALKNWLRIMLTATEPKAAISVTVPDPETDQLIVWVWNVATFGPLRHHEIYRWFPDLDMPSSSLSYGHLTDHYPDGPLLPLTERARRAFAPDYL
ncbi:hypothetical protein [Streptomyces sp. MBT27]|uniref:hypothetical protein n=1 Tax=Streptomyces sp. MBT27 TaxID=1488356 RepID=UPI00141DD5E9|nr:hypothetical protein [Streptomyces sp. MBT27]